MRVGGFQKTSLLDYPDCISSIIWTIDCNFRCPFCYNRNLVFGNIKPIPEEDVLSFLKKREGLLDGLVISGGEPLLQEDISDFAKKVKKIGYPIKVDTNGMYPERLKELIDNKLIDYIAMDIKAPKQKYSKLAGVKINLSKLEQSIDIIKNSAPKYEFRTTFVPDLLKKEDIIEIAKWLEGAEMFYLQQFRINPPLISLKMEKIIPYPEKYLIETLEEIQPYFKNCHLR